MLSPSSRPRKMLSDLTFHARRRFRCLELEAFWGDLVWPHPCTATACRMTAYTQTQRNLKMKSGRHLGSNIAQPISYVDCSLALPPFVYISAPLCIDESNDFCFLGLLLAKRPCVEVSFLRYTTCRCIGHLYMDCAWQPSLLYRCQFCTIS